MRNRVGITLLALAIIGTAGSLLINQVQAQTSSNSFSELAQVIAQRFGLNQSEVQSVVDQFHLQKRQNIEQMMMQKQEERLSQLVQEGKITEEQKQAIVKKITEVKSNYTPENLKNMTAEERKAAFQKQKQELRSWAEQNGIDLKYLFRGFGMRGHWRLK